MNRNLQLSQHQFHQFSSKLTAGSGRLEVQVVGNQSAVTSVQASSPLIESGGDNLAAHFSRELADYTIYVIDVAGGDKIPRKGGPGITQADLLVINKTDLAEAVGANLEVMERDARLMRGNGPFVFAQVRQRSEWA